MLYLSPTHVLLLYCILTRNIRAQHVSDSGHGWHEIIFRLSLPSPFGVSGYIGVRDNIFWWSGRGSKEWENMEIILIQSWPQSSLSLSVHLLSLYGSRSVDRAWRNLSWGLCRAVSRSPLDILILCCWWSFRSMYGSWKSGGRWRRPFTLMLERGVVGVPVFSCLRVREPKIDGGESSLRLRFWWNFISRFVSTQNPPKSPSFCHTAPWGRATGLKTWDFPYFVLAITFFCLELQKSL